MYYTQFVTGTNAQTGHLAERIRILREPALERHDLSFGWHISQTQEIDEPQVRVLLQEHGINYPSNVPIVYGDYSISDPDWNRVFWGWRDQLDEHLPVCMQPRWWIIANWRRFGSDPYGETQSLSDWLTDQEPTDLITQSDAAQIAGVTVQAISNAVRDGRLRGYENPDAPNPHKGGTLVRKSQVHQIWPVNRHEVEALG